MDHFFEDLKRTILDLIFPVACFGCRKEGFFLCRHCRDELVFIPPQCFVCGSLRPARARIPAGRTCVSCRKKTSIYAFLSPLSYETEFIRDLIHAFKYGRIRTLDRVLGDILSAYLEKFEIALPKNAILVPIPLHKSRIRTRGFNQAALIAGCLGEKLGISYEEGGFKRGKNTKPQVELAAQDRRMNLKNAFLVDDPWIFKDKTILLLDDVKTTGATMEEAARVLRGAGAKRIWAITVAH